MLAPIQPSQAPSSADYESLLSLCRFEALTTLRRLMTDPPESPAAARELRMTAATILRITPNPAPEPPQTAPREQPSANAPDVGEPRAPARGNPAEFSEPRAQARGDLPESSAPRAQARGPASESNTIPQLPNDAPEVAAPSSNPTAISTSQPTARRPSRRDRRAAAALRARCGAAGATQDSG